MTPSRTAASPSHGLAESVMRAQTALRATSTSVGLREAATRISEIAASSGCRALVPASASSRGAVSAAVLLSDDALTEADEADILAGRADKVLVIEVAAVSGLHVRRRVESLRRAGAEWIGLAVLHDFAPTTAPTTERFGAVDHLVAAG